jgi:hypothetical protein
MMKKIESWSQDVANMELMIENQAFNQHYYIINSSNIVQCSYKLCEKWTAKLSRGNNLTLV